ncbi:MAG: GIY-YIG nuclease family protein [Ignavibacteriae bacterium]|nr:GIY-YIG nuclease family protein [Ignavibacteriota bacterium]
MQNLPAMGIFKVENAVNNKLFVDFGLNVKGKINGCKFQLDNNSHPNKGLQEDYNTFGGNNFIFEVIDILEPKDNESKIMLRNLKYLKKCGSKNLKVIMNSATINVNVK